MKETNVSVTTYETAKNNLLWFGWIRPSGIAVAVGKPARWVVNAAEDKTCLDSDLRAFADKKQNLLRLNPSHKANNDERGSESITGSKVPTDNWILTIWLDKPACLIIRLLFGFVYQAQQKWKQILRRQCCLNLILSEWKLILKFCLLATFFPWCPFCMWR